MPGSAWRRALRVADRQKAALEVLDQAEAAAIRHNLLSDRVQIHYLRGNVYFPLGNIDGCLAEHEKALGFAREAGSTEGEALALGGLGDAYYLRGHMRSACEQFRACIALCQNHGYGRIEVANRHMVGWTRYHLMEHAEALEDALEVIRMATTVSHQRAKLLGLLLAGVVETDFGHFIAAEDYLVRGLELARALSAGNFEAQTLPAGGTPCRRGKIHQARNFAELAVEAVRKVGTTFIGPTCSRPRLPSQKTQRKAKRRWRNPKAFSIGLCRSQPLLVCAIRNRAISEDRRLGRS